MHRNVSFASIYPEIKSRSSLRSLTFSSSKSNLRKLKKKAFNRSFFQPLPLASKHIKVRGYSYFTTLNFNVGDKLGVYTRPEFRIYFKKATWNRGLRISRNRKCEISGRLAAQHWFGFTRLSDVTSESAGKRSRPLCNIL